MEIIFFSLLTSSFILIYYDCSITYCLHLDQFSFSPYHHLFRNRSLSFSLDLNSFIILLPQLNSHPYSYHLAFCCLLLQLFSYSCCISPILIESFQQIVPRFSPNLHYSEYLFSLTSEIDKSALKLTVTSPFSHLFLYIQTINIYLINTYIFVFKLKLDLKIS